MLKFRMLDDIMVNGYIKLTVDSKIPKSQFLTHFCLLFTVHCKLFSST